MERLQKPEVPEPCFWTRKVEFLRFDGVDPLSWMARAEICFEVFQVKEEGEISFAFLCMEAEVFHWYLFVRRCTPSLSWNSLILALLQKFGERVSREETVEEQDSPVRMLRVLLRWEIILTIHNHPQSLWGILNPLRLMVHQVLFRIIMSPSMTLFATLRS